MLRRAASCALFVWVIGWGASAAAQAAITSNTTLSATGVTHAAIGAAVAIDGDRALVAMPNAAGMPGAVYVFIRTSGTWGTTPEATLMNPMSTGGADSFGAQVTTGAPRGNGVALRGDVAVVGAPNFGAGQPGGAWIFHRMGPGSWSAGTPLTIPSMTPTHFGSSVAIGETAIVVGAPGDDLSSPGGAVVSYDVTGMGGTLVVPGSRMVGDEFGAQVALGGTTGGTQVLLVSSPHRMPQTVYSFTQAMGTTAWVAGRTFPHSAPGFGVSIALSPDGTALAIGSNTEIGMGRTGRVYVLTDGPVFGDIAGAVTLANPLSPNNDGFGGAVALDNQHHLVVGAPGTTSDSGTLLLYDVSTMTPVELAGFGYGSVMQGSQVGWSVALSGTTILAGAPDQTGSQGVAVVFPFPAFPGDTCMAAANCTTNYCGTAGGSMVCCDPMCSGLACGTCQANGSCMIMTGACTTSCGMGMCQMDGTCMATSPCDTGVPDMGASGGDGSTTSDMDMGPRPPVVHISGCKCSVGRAAAPNATIAIGVCLALFLSRRHSRRWSKC